ncbi:MAG: flagellar hook protein FlgE [Tranquillimonas sp.]|jgi:flagellar hook protein FlgE
MSITNALQTGVSGLVANSAKVGKISDNIANANTDGYKRSFTDFITTTTVSGAAGAGAAGVRAVARTDVTGEGTLRTTSRPYDMAITGQGFFVVTKNPNETMESNYMLTRAGSFTPDENGDLRNAAGYYLAGYPYGLDGTIGQVDRASFADLETVNLSAVQIVGSPTTEMSLSANLPAQETGAATPGDPFITTAEFYSPLGAADRLEFSWQPSATPNQWDLTVSRTDGTALGAVTVDFRDAGPDAGSPQTYSNVQSFATAPAAFAFDVTTGTATVTIDNGTPPQDVSISLGAPGTFEGMTQFAGDYTPPVIKTDGAETGTLVRTEIDEMGTLHGVFDNGNRKPLFSIPVAEVTDADAMIAAVGNAYLLTRDSGTFGLSTAGEGTAGVITAGSLEASNVEIAQELTDLIQTQRAYSSNAKIVTTMDEMLDETMRLKR